jgi:GDP-mannose 6-dehydrogenase
LGHDVIGVDVNPSKVQQLNAGVAPLVEPGLSKLVAEAVASGRLRATTSPDEAVHSSDLSVICVGTPTNRSGEPDMRHVREVAGQIGAAIAGKEAGHVVVVRSTVLPGTTKTLVTPRLEEASGRKAGQHFFVAHNPEFLREGSAIRDFEKPARTIIGAGEEETGRTVARLYGGVDAPVFVTSLETSEMVKFVDNVWHALKVCFGNEVGNICKASGVDSHAVMDLFCEDTKLNISPAYLRPGFAFGGSCLPKDTRAMLHKARELTLEVPLIKSIMPSNKEQIERAVEIVLRHKTRRVAMLGLSFKAGTDDLRESPQVELAERLIGKGIEIKVFDPALNLAALTGANRDYILNVLPHLNELLVEDIDTAIEDCGLVIVGNRSREFENLSAKVGKGQHVLDLAGFDLKPMLGERYDGINW